MSVIDLYNFYSLAYIYVIGSIQNEDINEHNNFIKLALWKSLRIDSSLFKSDLVVFVRTDINKKINSSRIISFRHVLFDDFIFRLWRIYMSFFDDENNFKNVVNDLNRENRKDYKRFNVFLSKNKSIMNNINWMNELRQFVHLNLQMI